MDLNTHTLEPQNLGHIYQYPQTFSSSASRVPPISVWQDFASGAVPPVFPLQSSAITSHAAHGLSPASLAQPHWSGSYSIQASSSPLVVRSSRRTPAGHPYSQSRAPRAAADYHPYHHHQQQQHTPDHFAEPFVPAPGWAPDTQSPFMVLDPRPIHPQSNMNSTPIPMSVQGFQMPMQAVAEHADVEFAGIHYGNKPCFYQCRYDLNGSPCGKCIVGDRRRILRHLRNYHHVQTASSPCRWENCTKYRPMRQENLARHIVTHLGVKWKCSHCEVPFSRDDAVRRHIERVLPGVEVPVDIVPGRDARSLSKVNSEVPRSHFS